MEITYFLKVLVCTILSTQVLCNDENEGQFTTTNEWQEVTSSLLSRLLPYLKNRIIYTDEEDIINDYLDSAIDTITKDLDEIHYNRLNISGYGILDENTYVIRYDNLTFTGITGCKRTSGKDATLRSTPKGIIFQLPFTIPNFTVDLDILILLKDTSEFIHGGASANTDVIFEMKIDCPKRKLCNLKYINLRETKLRDIKIRGELSKHREVAEKEMIRKRGKIRSKVWFTIKDITKKIMKALGGE